MGSFKLHSDFALGVVVGIIATIALAGIISVTLLRSTDRYGLGHWKLNIRTPLRSMWMNVGYWKDANGKLTQNFDEACAALLRQVLDASGILKIGSPGVPRGSIGILDVGFGCGDQTWEIARLTQASGWAKLRYVGLTLDKAQVQSAQQRIYREIAQSDITGVDVESFQLFRANASKPKAWSPQVTAAVTSLAESEITENWLLALDCLYYFTPSREPLFKYAAEVVGANIMVFDLFINETASRWNILLLRVVGVMMGCPLWTFLTEQQYRSQLVECGYDEKSVLIREITEDVFPGLVKFLDNQDQGLSEYGISLGGFKLAQRLFDWFARSKAVRAVVVTAHVRERST